jgi:hypothetical protein
MVRRWLIDRGVEIAVAVARKAGRHRAGAHCRQRNDPIRPLPKRACFQGVAGNNREFFRFGIKFHHHIKVLRSIIWK